MQQDLPTDPYSGEALRDGEVRFDPIAYLGDHPIAAGIVIVVLLIFFFWYMRRRTR